MGDFHFKPPGMDPSKCKVGGTKMPMGQWGSVSSIFWGQGFRIKRFVYFGQNVVAF